jgi:hypothetical protein
MPTKRLSMRHLREILRLRLHGGLSVRQIHSSLRVSVGGVQKVIKKAQEQSLDWDSVNQLNDRQLASLFYPQADTRAAPCHELPDSCGRNTPSSSLTAAIAILSSVFCTNSGWPSNGAPCARSIKPAISCLSTMLGKPYPSYGLIPAKSALPRSSSPCWARLITRSVKPPGHSSCPTGWKAMPEP